MKNSNFLFLISLLFITACGQFGEGEYNPTETLVPIDGVTFKDIVKDIDNDIVVGATVTLYADNNRYSTTTDAYGIYEIVVPHEELPSEGYLSISVVADGYKPHNLTYESRNIDSGTYGAGDDILMSPCPNCLDINGEKSSELVHLGDDQYAGAANSQFQKSTDGLEMSFQIRNSAEYPKIKLTFEAKGLQPSHFDLGSSVIFGNGEIEEFVTDSPEDGSYGSYSFTVDNSALVQTITFKTRDHGTPGSDYDDWEFTCLHIEGIQ